MALKNKKSLQNRTRKIIAILEEQYPSAKTALRHESPFELLVATILSAQCTDARVNMVTPVLFQKYPSVKDFADAVPQELEQDIRSTGFCNSLCVVLEFRPMISATSEVVSGCAFNICRSELRALMRSPLG